LKRRPAHEAICEERDLIRGRRSMADGIAREPKAVEELLAHGYQVKTGAYLKQGWEQFKRYPIGFIGFALLLTLVSQALPIFAQTFGQFLSLVVGVIMMAGIALVVWKQLQRRPATFADFFPDWQTTGRLILCTILGLLLILVGLFLFVIPGIYLMVGYTFSYMLITDRGLPVWQALETSRRVVGKNWWGVFGLTVMTALLILGGMVVGGLILGVPLGTLLAQYYPPVSVADFFSDPPGVLLEMNMVVNQGMIVALVSGMMLGMGLGLALAGCMLGVAYADIFGLAGWRPKSAEAVSENIVTTS
jgi:uncharacterized membrane protein